MGGANHASGPTSNNLVDGTIALAGTPTVAKNCPVNIAFTPTTAPPQRLDDWLRPLLAIADERTAAGKAHFQSHIRKGPAIELRREPRYRRGNC